MGQIAWTQRIAVHTPMGVKDRGANGRTAVIPAVHALLLGTTIFLYTKDEWNRAGAGTVDQ